MRCMRCLHCSTTTQKKILNKNDNYHIKINKNFNFFILRYNLFYNDLRVLLLKTLIESSIKIDFKWIFIL